MNAKFDLSGMHCESCALDIQETLEDTSGVRRAEVSYAERQAVVDFDETRVRTDQLVNAIHKLGYAARPITAPETSSHTAT